jgi:hypothetical protein
MNQNPTTTRSNPAQPRTAPPPLEASRPHSLAELAETAKQSLGDDRPFKTWLRIAEIARRDAKSFQEQGDLEASFIEFARAATIVLEKIPSHPDYRVLLTTTQRHNMGLVSYLGPLHFALPSGDHPHLPTNSIYDHAACHVVHVGLGPTKRRMIRSSGFQLSFCHASSCRLNPPPPHTDMAILPSSS